MAIGWDLLDKLYLPEYPRMYKHLTINLTLCGKMSLTRLQLGTYVLLPVSNVEQHYN